MPKLRGDVVPHYGTLAPDSSHSIEGATTHPMLSLLNALTLSVI